MNNTNNDERLKILQERLSQINEKSNYKAINKSTEDKIQQESIEEYSKQDNANINNENNQPKSSSLGKYFLIIIVFGLAAYFIYPKITDINITNKQINKVIDNNPIINTDIKEKIKYNLSMEGSIAIIDSTNDENIAKAMINKMQVKGFKCNYFYLPEKSNSKKEIYKIYIGPYENPNEMKQWLNNIEKKGEIIIL